jgi:hypothetical protein
MAEVTDQRRRTRGLTPTFRQRRRNLGPAAELNRRK